MIVDMTKFTCPMCMNWFASKQVLQTHSKRKCVEKKFKCMYCEKRFTSNKSMLRHRRNTCRHKERVDNKIDDVSDKCPTQTINNNITTNNNITNNNINVNIVLNRYDAQDVEGALGCEEDITKLLGRSLSDVITNLVKKIHIDHVPNRNLYVSNINGSNILTFDGKIWNQRDKNEILDDLVRDNTQEAADLMRRHGDALINYSMQDPYWKVDIINQKLDDVDKNPKVKNKAKKDIHLMLVNNRDKVKRTYEKHYSKKIRTPV